MALTVIETKSYWDEGFLFPKRVISETQAANYLTELECFESETGGPVKGKWRYKSHLVFPWMNQLMRQYQVLALARGVLVDDLMVWTTHLYPKEAGDGRFISWHQDSAHWGLDSNLVLTIWVALTEVNVENGCMHMLPGSHKKGMVSHHDTWDKHNILTRGQTITQRVDENDTVQVQLRPGEASLHHVEIFHSSKPNISTSRRVGVAIRYIAPAAYQTRIDEDYATLVCGEDRFRNFKREKAPKKTMSKEAVAFHERVAGLQGKIYLSNTNRAGIKGLVETNDSSS